MTSATNVVRMFSENRVFNQNISSWQMDNVTSFYRMFYVASTYNMPMDAWRTGSVTDMGRMFHMASDFNQALDSWQTDSVKTMESLFYSADKFNQPLNSWQTSSVKDMRSTFLNADDFIQNLSSWQVEEVTSYSDMFTCSGSSPNTTQYGAPRGPRARPGGNTTLPSAWMVPCAEAETTTMSIPDGYGGFTEYEYTPYDPDAPECHALEPDAFARLGWDECQ